MNSGVFFSKASFWGYFMNARGQSLVCQVSCPASSSAVTVPASPGCNSCGPLPFPGGALPGWLHPLMPSCSFLPTQPSPASAFSARVQAGRPFTSWVEGSAQKQDCLMEAEDLSPRNPPRSQVLAPGWETTAASVSSFVQRGSWQCSAPTPVEIGVW